MGDAHLRSVHSSDKPNAICGSATECPRPKLAQINAAKGPIQREIDSLHLVSGPPRRVFGRLSVPQTSVQRENCERKLHDIHDVQADELFVGAYSLTAWFGKSLSRGNVGHVVAVDSSSPQSHIARRGREQASTLIRSVGPPDASWRGGETPSVWRDPMELVRPTLSLVRLKPLCNLSYR